MTQDSSVQKALSLIQIPDRVIQTVIQNWVSSAADVARKVVKIDME